MFNSLNLSKKLYALSLQKQLSAIVGLSGLLYWLIFSFPFPLTQLYQFVPPLDYAKLTSHSRVGFISYVLLILALFSLYGLAIRLTVMTQARSVKLSFWQIMLGALFLNLVLVVSYPLMAIDLFVYALRTRSWAWYDLNPLATQPDMLPASDPLLGLAGEWLDAASPYGSIWELTSLLAFYLTGGNFLAHLFALKLVAILAYAGICWFIYSFLKRHQPERMVRGTIIFAWNPLILLETAQNGHNDMLMSFFLLLTIWLATHQTLNQRLPRLALLLLVLLSFVASILVKFVTLIIMPFLLLALTHEERSWLIRLGQMIGLSLIICTLTMLALYPLWPGLEQWAVLTAGSQAGRSLLTLLILSLRNFVGTNLAFDLSRALVLFGFSLIYLYLLWQIFRYKPTVSDENSLNVFRIYIRAMFYALFWYVLLVAPVFHAWYLIWFLPLAPLLLPDPQPLHVGFVFSLTALLVIPYFETIRVWYPYLLQNQWLGHLIGVSLLVLPPTLTALQIIRPQLGLVNPNGRRERFGGI
ncbi:hypothetical protein QUF64_10490 [Anaerolineales bacterium HSG6]|nr:hypothetical protein [Anaerolineales bacterium HSG6]